MKKPPEWPEEPIHWGRVAPDGGSVPDMAHYVECYLNNERPRVLNSIVTSRGHGSRLRVIAYSDRNMPGGWRIHVRSIDGELAPDADAPLPFFFGDFNGLDLPSELLPNRSREVLGIPLEDQADPLGEDWAIRGEERNRAPGDLDEDSA